MLLIYQAKDTFQEFRTKGIVQGLWSEMFIENKTAVSEFYIDCLAISTSLEVMGHSPTRLPPPQITAAILGCPQSTKFLPIQSQFWGFPHYAPLLSFEGSLK